MILTRLDRMITDDYTSDVAEALEYFCAHKTSIINQDPDSYIVNEQITYTIHSSEPKTNILSKWESRTCKTVHIILEGEEIMDISDIDDLTSLQNHRISPHIQYYEGFAQTRVQLRKHNIIILFPEDAYRESHNPSQKIKKCIFYIKIIP